MRVRAPGIRVWHVQEEAGQYVGSFLPDALADLEAATHSLRTSRARARGRRRRDEGVCLSESAILPVRVSVWLFTGKSFHFDTEDT